MARAKSHLMSIIRGSVGGLTYLANQYHQIVMRQRTAPVDPGSNPQMSMRSSIAAASGLWRTFATELRQKWADYAATLQYEGPLGKYKVPGRNVMMGTNAVARYLNDNLGLSLSLIGEAPGLPGFLPLGSVHIVPPSGPAVTGFGISVGNDTLDDILVYLSRSFAFDDTRNSFKGPFIQSTLQSFVVPAQTTAVHEIVGLVTDSIYFVKLRGITDDVGARLSSEYILRAIAEDSGP